MDSADELSGLLSQTSEASGPPKPSDACTEEEKATIKGDANKVNFGAKQGEDNHDDLGGASGSMGLTGLKVGDESGQMRCGLRDQCYHVFGDGQGFVQQSIQ